jgi:hypothetical protein
MKTVYFLTSTNMVGAGGHQLNASTPVNWMKCYQSAASAKRVAEHDYGKRIEWHKRDNGGFSSGDMLYVMYEIKKIKVNE